MRFGTWSSCPASEQIVHAGVLAEPVTFGEGVVLHALEALGIQTGFTRPGGQLAGFDQAGKFVCAFGQEFEDVFVPDDRKQKRCGVAVER